MQVETYEQAELLATGRAEDISDPEALALIETLGLDGQRDLLRRAEDSDTKRNPFRRMTQEERNVYGVLLPNVVELAEYASAPIPLRVLQCAGVAKQFFGRLEVWSPADARGEDPLLVGRAGRYDEPWLLARWGEELLDLDALRKLARVKLRASYKARVQKAAADVKAVLDRADSIVDEYLTGGSPDVPYLHLTIGR